MTHPAIDLAPELMRPALARILEAGDVCDPDDPAECIAAHVRGLLAGGRGDPWLAFALGLHRPELLAQLPPADEVIGAMARAVGVSPAEIGAEYYVQDVRQATAPDGPTWAFGEAPVFLAGGAWDYRPGVLPDAEEVGAGPLLVTPGTLHAFVERIEAGYAAADAELADAVPPVPGIDGATKPAALEGAAAALDAAGQAASAAWARQRAAALRAGTAKPLASSGFIAGWQAQLAAWRKFYEAHRSAYLFSGSAWDSAEAFRLALADWSARAKAELGRGFRVLPGAEPEGPSVVGAALDAAWSLGALALLVFLAMRS